MSLGKKRKITISVLSMAGGAVLLALLLQGGEAETYTPPPTPIAVKPFTFAPDPQPPTPVEPAKPAEPPKVDVVFVLDTTGSMSGLIQGAKRKIWSIANQILGGQPKPHVRIGLIGYRDLGDDYVTRRFALTEDMDDVYANLQGFEAGGGGDTPEHVNRALSEAISKMQWREGQGVLRQIFLVGDAPPHEGRDGLFSRQLARRAADDGIVINAVRCGSMVSTEQAWRRIVLAAGGMYASIRQDGGMVAITSPYDERLKELNLALSSTLLPTGGEAAKAAVRRRARVNASMDAFAQAESAKYRAGSGRIDSKDLLTVISRGKKLSDMREEELPAPVAALPAAERKEYVAKVAEKRKQLKREIAELARKRDGFIRAKRPAAANAFDDSVGAALKVQGKAAGIAY